MLSLPSTDLTACAADPLLAAAGVDGCMKGIGDARTVNEVDI